MFKLFETRPSALVLCHRTPHTFAELGSFTYFYVCMFKLQFVFVRSDAGEGKRELGSGLLSVRRGSLRVHQKMRTSSLYSLEQWFSNFLHQVPPQKIFGFPSTTIITNIKMQYKWLPTAPGVCSRCVFTVCVCVFTAVCVCTLDGLNAEHKFRVCHVTFTFSSTMHSKKKVSLNPYKDIYYCQPLKI